MSPLCCSVLKSQGWGEQSRGFLWGGKEKEEESGGVKSHLEAMDEAEFHEQHLEFQLHHEGQTHSGIQHCGGGRERRSGGGMLGDGKLA